MRRNISKALEELVSEQILTQEKVDEIRNYYLHKNDQAPNRLMIVFGILGALLVGLGIILILAHNWDDLSRSFKTVIAFVPLLIGQLACGYTIWKQKDSITWKEGSGTFLFLGIGACISLISQIYNISGDMSSFILTWILLALPSVYILRSSVSSLFYIIGMTYYACEVGYFQRFNEIPYLYIGLLMFILPHYYFLFKNRGGSNFTAFHHLFIPTSVVIVLGTVTGEHWIWMFMAYMSLFGLLAIIGNSHYFDEHHSLFNGPSILGSIGTVFLLIVMSFHDFWKELVREDAKLFTDGPFIPEFITAVVLSIGAIGLFAILHRRRTVWEPSPVTWIFIVFIPIFFIAFANPLWGTILINILTFLLGLYKIRDGARSQSLRTLNFGLLIVSVLICCRFFDTDISFFLRGLIFVALGAGFFAANYFMLKKKKSSTLKA